MSSQIPDAKVCTVLVAEDDRDVRESVRMILEHDGFTTIGASNGAEALALMKSERPDFILLDLNLPVLTGLDFLYIKAEDPLVADIPVIAITGHAQRETPPGVIALLRKPFDLDHFLALVRAERLAVA